MTRHTHSIALFLAGGIAFLSSASFVFVSSLANVPSWVTGFVLSAAGVSCLLFAAKAQRSPGNVFDDVEEVMRR